MEAGVVMATQNFKRKKIWHLKFVSSCSLRERLKMSDTCSLFPLFGDPWPSCLLRCYWERLRVRGAGGDRRWDGWMSSLIQWTWVWTNSGRYWRTGKPDVLQFMRLQRVGHDLATEQQQIICEEVSITSIPSFVSILEKWSYFLKVIAVFKQQS